MRSPMGVMPETFALASALLVSTSSADTLWENGPFVTSPGGGFSGADVSELQTSLGGASLGYGSALFHGQTLADDFTLEGDAIIESITCYAYQTNAPTSGTMTGLYLRIWNGPPNEPSSEIVWGDAGEFLETNLMAETFWTGAYRASDANPLNNTRAIMALVADLDGAPLSSGTYWMEWGASGSFALIGPLAVPVTYDGAGGSGNALRYNPKRFQWEDAIDGGPAAWHDDFPFIIEGAFETEPADLDGDGVVAFSDLLLSAWGECREPCDEDLNDDGVVGFADLLILLAAWTIA